MPRKTQASIGATPLRYEFDDLMLDVGQRRVTRGSSELKLGNLTFDLLRALVESARNVVTYDELSEKVWGGRPVTHATVAQRVLMLRRDLSDSAEQPRYVETVSGRGYRLVPRVTVASDRGQGRGAWFWRIGFASAGALVLLVAGLVLRDAFEAEPAALLPNSVAVLPFENLSADPEDAHFTAGIHQETLNQLAKIGSLKVISRTSVMEYLDTAKNMRQIGQELDVATILEGGVQRAEDMVRINVQLINAETDEHLWAETYDRELTPKNLFAMQGEIAMAIAVSLQAKLTPEEVARLNEVPTRSARALDLYQRGNDYFWRSDFATYTPLAVQMFQRAVDEDPEFALAWGALSRAHVRLYWQNIDRRDARHEAALHAAQRAFELAPKLPEAHLAMGVYHYMAFRDYDKALAELDTAERGMPGAVEIFIARADIHRRRGEWEESNTAYDRTIELDPRNFFLYWNQADNYMWLRRYERAERLLDRALEIAPDELRPYREKLQMPLLRDGDVTRIKAAIERPLVEPSFNRQLFGWAAAIYERDYETALRYLADLEIDGFGSWIRVPGINNLVIKASLYGITYKLASESALAEAQFTAARTQLQAMLKRNPEDYRLHEALGGVLANLGEREAAARSARHAMELAVDHRSAANVRLDAAFIFAQAGDAEAAIEALDTYLDNPGRWSIEGLLPDPRLDPIRDDPRFRALVEKHRRQ